LATVEDVAKVKLSGDLAGSRRSLGDSDHTKRATFNGCSSTQQSAINAAVSSAQSYASSTYSYISGISSGTTRYTTWFGPYDASRKSTIQDHFQKDQR